MLARARRKLQVMQEGRPDDGYDQELAMIVAQIRRLLSVTTSKAQVGCLLWRLHQVAPGNKQPPKKGSGPCEWGARSDLRHGGWPHQRMSLHYQGAESGGRGALSDQ